MKVSLNWLSNHLDLSDLSVEALSDLLTFAGIEVEGIEQRGTNVDRVVVGRIAASEKHPNADKLSVCQVDDGSGTPKQVVCGAKNYQVGDLVPFAQPGCALPGGFTIAEREMRGVKSQGMLCSAAELGLAAESDGLMLLPATLTPGQPLSEVFERDTLFDLEITPNRPDLLSHLGMARELSALTGRPLCGASHHGPPDSASRAATAQEIILEALEACPYYVGRWIRGVRVGASPDWLCSRLEAAGLRPINNIVDITNYVMLEMGQPLHAFDLAKLQGGIKVRQATAGEEFLALDGKSYALLADDLVIADSAKAVAIAGVMGGEESGVSEGTTDILLEAAWFHPAGVRRTARRLGLHSDSSYRFERRVDPAQVAGASALATRLILEIAGGKADPQAVAAGAPPAPPVPVPFQPEQCRRLMGCDISDDAIGRILGQLGIVRTEQGWTVPTYRADLERAVDLIEEVARVYGLDAVPASRGGTFVTASPADAAYDFALSLRRRLASLGYFECRTLKLVSPTQVAQDWLPLRPGLGPVPLKNPLNDEQSHLRPSLLPGLLATAARNVRQGTHSLRLFEAGRVFGAAKNGQEVEQERLALLLSGPAVVASWCDPQPPVADLHDLRGLVEALFPGQTVALTPMTLPGLPLAASVDIGTVRKAGLTGILSPGVARELDIDHPVIVAEFDLGKLQTLAATSPRFAELPRYPAVTRDVALLVDVELGHAALANVFGAQREPLLAGCSLFDVFTDASGDRLPAGKKSLAYTLTYRAPDRTLAMAEVDAAHQRILEALKKSLAVEIR